MRKGCGEHDALPGVVQVEDCNSLQGVEMHVATMTHLALGSCPSLEVLSLSAPALTQLDLQCAPAPASHAPHLSSSAKWHSLTDAALDASGVDA